MLEEVIHAFFLSFPHLLMAKQDQSLSPFHTQDNNHDMLIINTDPQPNQKETLERFSHHAIIHIPLPPTPSSSSSFGLKEEELSGSLQDSTRVQWDPHIDSFEILRAKITGITRAMQAFHVQELFQDDERLKQVCPQTTSSSPLVSSQKPCSLRRLSLAEEQSRRPKSPHLSTLFLTTNNLIHSRLDELSETASIKSNQDVSLLAWQTQFLNLVTSCIHQSEALESLSTDILTSEHRVRELMLINETLHEQFQQRERQYEERIRECQEVAQQQLMMIDSLEELTADINMKIQSVSLNSTHSPHHEQEDCWNFQRPVADLMQMEDKFDFVQKMRWEIGMFVGGGVGTGHVIHTYDTKLNGFDMIIAGTGTTTTYHPTIMTSISPTIQHLQLYQYRYLLHINSIDRKTRFCLLPKHLWVPDHQADQCQFQNNNPDYSCQTRFSLFQRRHHCRRCGLIVCQKHSANRLPLFDVTHPKGAWSRVCDDCFYELIIT
ncbi:hypothetical protein A0J61_10421 [Choanephora cucurbitarum]|uniref:FYVE-type domain-containing protein n=1 Tax=Choanephora cucurbitarum TaxID=101091 RepID=A0A1C7MYQ2_9FUNG|nr:hypothetical protein A0J61_10421 [Choanephora cucurbitarum]